MDAVYHGSHTCFEQVHIGHLPIEEVPTGYGHRTIAVQITFHCQLGCGDVSGPSRHWTMGLAASWSNGPSHCEEISRRKGTLPYGRSLVQRHRDSKHTRPQWTQQTGFGASKLWRESLDDLPCIGWEAIAIAPPELMCTNNICISVYVWKRNDKRVIA